MDIDQARFNMIEQQIRPWDVRDARVLDLYQTVPREAFVEDQYQTLAFADIEIPIGHSQIMMSPKVEARMLQALNVQPHESILEIGTGSGFITALLAKLGRHVTTIEYFEDLARYASQHLQLQQISNVDCLTGDIFGKLHVLNNYNVIAVTGSVPEDTDLFSRHLLAGGRLFCITGNHPVMTAKLITCVDENDFMQQELFETDLPPLLLTKKIQEFSF